MTDAPIPLDSLRKINIMMRSGVLQPLSVAAALHLTEPEWLEVFMRRVELTPEQAIAIDELADDYAIALNDVNMLRRDLGRSPYIRDDQGDVRGYTMSMPEPYEEPHA